MKKTSIRPSILALSSLMLATAFSIYRVNSQEIQSQPTQHVQRVATAEQIQAGKKFREALAIAQKEKFRAVLNNGSQRKGVALDELPEEMRPQAALLEKQYKEGIYPQLQKYVAENDGALPDVAFTMPQFAHYMEDAEYKGVGPKSWGRGSWAIAGSKGQRPDGTVVARDVYSHNLPNEPHDVWANYNKFVNSPSIGKGFIINGWDDGRVTFDLAEDNFYGVGKDFRGQEYPGAAIPGQAGIPPEFKQGLKAWRSKLLKDMAEVKAAKNAHTKTQGSAQLQ